MKATATINSAVCTVNVTGLLIFGDFKLSERFIFDPHTAEAGYCRGEDLRIAQVKFWAMRGTGAIYTRSWTNVNEIFLRNYQFLWSLTPRTKDNVSICNQQKDDHANNRINNASTESDQAAYCGVLDEGKR